MVEKLDPRQKPPDSLRALHKHYQRASAEALTDDINVYDFSSVQQDVTATGLSVVRLLKGPQLLEIMSRFGYCGEAPAATEDVKVYECADLPGNPYEGRLVSSYTDYQAYKFCLPFSLRTVRDAFYHACCTEI